MADGRSRIDRLMEESARAMARRTSRRSFLARLGGLLVGSAGLPLLPVARVWAEEASGGVGEPPGDKGDPAACSYWRHCAIDGFLCSCCGGTQSGIISDTPQLPS